MVYWANLPTVSTFQALHYSGEQNHKRVKLFWIAFTIMFVYEIFPSYIFPLLNGFSIICLATQKAPSGAVDVITNLFGGSDGNEGLGFLSLGFDWQYITSTSMSLPLYQQGVHIFVRSLPSVHDASLTFDSELLGWFVLLLYRRYGYLLFERLEREYRNTTPFGRSWY